MSDTIQVPADEHGVIRVFRVQLAAEEIADFAGQSGEGAALAAALGVERLNPEYVEVFPVSDLTGLGLAGYLSDGLGVPPEDLAADRAMLEAVEGYVLVLSSGALEGRAETLRPRAPLRWMGTWHEAGQPVEFKPLPAGGAQGGVHTAPVKTPSNNAILGRVAMMALLVLFALTALMVWIS
ncbi:hypothetical protein ACM25N_15120 [Roseovarius sp. C7]|uniref:hypothetical protein n=1 Tax=Roseovarius sp. C7 TaxID=3398643 RepID=UPI0039F673DA